MTTVKQLISWLSEIEDKDQAIIYQYYLAEHFDTDDDTFSKVSTELDGVIPGDNWGIIYELIKEKNN